MRLIRRAGRRSLLRHPVQAVLAIGGVALGVAVVVAIDIANDSARAAMGAAIERVAGRATHQVVGGPDGYDASLYRELRVDLGLDRAAPVVEGGIRIAGAGDASLRLLGLDPFAEAPFRGYLAAADDRGIDLAALIAGEPVLYLPGATLTRLRRAPGHTVQVQAPGGAMTVTLGPAIEAPGRDLDGLAFADIAFAQRLLGREGRLDRIDLILGPGGAEAVTAALPDGVHLVSAARRGNALVQMSRAFRVNLTALSLLALVVGLFLVFNTMRFLVLRRRRWLGTLRALGAQRRQVRAQVFADALAVATAGTALGLVLGAVLANLLTGLVLRTIDQLYIDVAAGMVVAPRTLAKAAALGIAGTLVSAWLPARSAAAATPRAALSRAELETGALRSARYAAVLGVLLGAVGVVLLNLSTGLVPGFAGLFAIILGAAALVPWLTRLAGLGLRGVVGLPWWLRMAAGNLAAAISRTGVAVAALTVAVATVIGVSLMIDSFRLTVADWLERTLSADFYVSAPAPFEPALAERVRRVGGVDGTASSRWYRQPTESGFIQLWGLAVGSDAWRGIDVIRGDSGRAAASGPGAPAVLVSEVLGHKRGLEPGDMLELPTARGSREFLVAGVFRNYSAIAGVVLMPLRVYRGYWHDRSLTGVGVYVDPRADRGNVRTRLEQAASTVPGTTVSDNRSIRRRSMQVFDQTFAVTSVLRLLAIIVAFAGVMGALMALQLERRREFATLKAIGAGRRELAGLIGAESGLLGALAGGFAIPLGIALSWLLIFVINRRAFGWTMDFELAPALLAGGAGLAVVAALLAAIYPARRAAVGLPAQGLRDE